MFYLAVVHAVLIFGVETWVLLKATSWKLEGLHVGFLKQIIVHRSVRQRDMTW